MTPQEKQGLFLIIGSILCYSLTLFIYQAKAEVKMTARVPENPCNRCMSICEGGDAY